MVRVLVLGGVLVALVAGGVVGGLGRRALESPHLAAPRLRPAVLEDVHRALERSDGPALEGALARAAAAGLEEPEDRAELDLLGALGTGARRGLFAVLEDHPGTAAAARARWEILVRTPPGPRRDARRVDFARRHPDAWAVREGGP